MTEVARQIEPVKADDRLPYDRLCHCDDREKWLEQRKDGIGASESAAIMGMSPHLSEYTLYQQRVGGIPAPKDNEHNRYMVWGNRLEPIIAAAYAEDTGREIFRNGWLCRSKRYPWLLATPDYDQVDHEHGHGLLECKNTGESYADDWEEHIPPKFQCQLQHQLLVVGLTWGSVACLIGGNDDRYGNLAAHERFQAALARKTERFVKMLHGELPPPEPDAHPSTSETLARMVENGKAVKLPDVALYWHQEQVKYAKMEREAKDRKREYEALIKAAIGTATFGVLPGDNGVYKFKTVNQPEKIMPASSKRQLRHLKRMPKETKK